MTDWKAEARRLKFTRHRSYSYIAKRLGIDKCKVQRLLSKRAREQARQRRLRPRPYDPEQMEQELKRLRALTFQ